MAGDIKMTLLDSVISQIAPTIALRRVKARMALDVTMNYDAASFGRRLAGWKAPATDADAAAQMGRPRMRQLSRDLIRNAPFATRAQSVVTGNVVGLGIRPSIADSKAAGAKHGQKILDHMLSTDIDAHGQQNILGLQQTVMNSVFESGEILALRRMRPNAPRLKLPFQAQLVEPDHLDTWISAHEKNEVREGVEYDHFGRIVAYHIFDEHPGTASTRFRLKSRRWPASEVLHIRRIDRAGQLRGVPWLAPVMVTLGELRDYQEAQIVKQKMSALLTVVVENNQALTPDQKGLTQMAPGAVVHTTEGQSVSFSDPPKVDDYDPVMRQGLTAVAMGVGITYEALSGNLGNVNFSSGQMGRLEMDRNIESWQSTIIIQQFCDGISRWSDDAVRLEGGRPASYLLNWTPPRRPLVNPTKEIPILMDQVDRGVISLQRVQRGLGYDPDVIKKERDDDILNGNVKPAPPPKPKKGTPE